MIFEPKIAKVEKTGMSAGFVFSWTVFTLAIYVIVFGLQKFVFSRLIIAVFLSLSVFLLGYLLKKRLE